jgi:hypothetical protein
VLFNSDEGKDGKAFTDTLDGLLHKTADEIKKWPDVDLFHRFCSIAARPVLRPARARAQYQNISFDFFGVAQSLEGGLQDGVAVVAESVGCCVSRSGHATRGKYFAEPCRMKAQPDTRHVLSLPGAGFGDFTGLLRKDSGPEHVGFMMSQDNLRVFQFEPELIPHRKAESLKPPDVLLPASPGISLWLLRNVEGGRIAFLQIDRRGRSGQQTKPAEEKAGELITAG